MLDRFSRTELIYGKAAMQRLAGSHVAVFGIGGVGGYTVEALVRSGIGAIDIIDDDKVCLTNLNRQIYALESTIGRYKVDVAAERIRDINPECRLTAHRKFFSPETASGFDFSQYDYIVDAIDTVSAKLELVRRAVEAGVPIISSMGAGNKTDPTAFEVTDIYKTSVCPLAKVMRYELRRMGIKHLKVVYSKEVPVKPSAEGQDACLAEQSGAARTGASRRTAPGSNAFVPPTVGLIIAGEVVNYLTSPINN